MQADNKREEERAEQDRYVAGRADIWNTARSMLRNSGTPYPSPEEVLDLARFLAGDGMAAFDVS